jgi:hypothetical protein
VTDPYVRKRPWCWPGSGTLALMSDTKKPRWYWIWTRDEVTAYAVSLGTIDALREYVARRKGSSP